MNNKLDKVQKVVYFIRHGESEANISPTFQEPGSPLSPNGREQAQKIANRVARLDFETLISSPYQRAKETAGVIAQKTGRTPEYSDLFVECIKPTKIYGKSFDDNEANNIWREWQKSLRTPGLRAEDGENIEDLLSRADKALEFLKNRPEKSIVVVSHGFFLKTIILKVLLGSLISPEVFHKFDKSIYMENTGLTAIHLREIFEEDPAWRLWIFNDHAHLG